MSRRFRRKRGRLVRHVRQPPGTMIANPESPPPRLTVIAFGPDGYEEKQLERPQELERYLGRWPVVWLNVDGLGDVEVIRQIGELLHMHPLALEDVVDTSQRPKLDVYHEGTFMVLRSAELRESLILEQMAIFIGGGSGGGAGGGPGGGSAGGSAGGFVATFQEMPGDCLDEIRDRIRRGRGRVRRAAPAYLGYILCDAIIDSYFVVLERYGDELEVLEQQILSRPQPALLSRLFEIKRELLAIRRAAWPLRDVAAQLGQESVGLGEEIRLYARDAHDHAARIIDLVESFRELTSSMVDIYLANLSAQMNQIVKVLTIISTICIPLSVIVGIYGMNFDHMPELHWRYGYLVVLGAMVLVVVAMLTWFWRRGWIGRRDLLPEEAIDHRLAGHHADRPPHASAGAREANTGGLQPAGGTSPTRR